MGSTPHPQWTQAPHITQDCPYLLPSYQLASNGLAAPNGYPNAQHKALFNFGKLQHMNCTDIDRLGRAIGTLVGILFTFLTRIVLPHLSPATDLLRSRALYWLYAVWVEIYTLKSYKRHKEEKAAAYE
ncbi:hypothetical protein PROFUN_15911 [Planoprotostelium fungivorum]|uniref:Uncharacterized protein n=1 Tax=Planoprotostelium fungivorum TaxID=1890364 RepID=A0A2P6MSY4_9EUKA|nr:hypothetical protein PROFUN_15911 [Planoprotostelium fungivorum]